MQGLPGGYSCTAINIGLVERRRVWSGLCLGLCLGLQAQDPSGEAKKQLFIAGKREEGGRQGEMVVSSTVFFLPPISKTTKSQLKSFIL